MADPIEHSLASALGLAPTASRLTPRASIEHQSNRLYDLWAGDRHLIVKEFLKPEEQAVAPLREHRALRLLEPLDIAPRPVLLLPAAPGHGPLVVYEWMAGTMWDRHRPSGADLARLADLFVTVHSVSADRAWLSRGTERPLADNAAEIGAGFDAYAAWANADFPAGRPAAERCVALLASRRPVIADLTARAPTLCFCHSDERFANVIQRPDGRLGMVDWEDSGLRDPARDVADLISHANQEDLVTWAEWQAFLTPYLAAHGSSDPDLAERLHLYLALFPLFWLYVLLGVGLRRAGAGRLAGWTTNGQSPNARLRRYLARALAWPAMDFSAELAALGDLAFFPPGD